MDIPVAFSGEVWVMLGLLAVFIAVHVVMYGKDPAWWRSSHAEKRYSWWGAGVIGIATGAPFVLDVDSLAIFMSIVVFVMIGLAVLRARHWRRLKAHKWLLCPGCEYPLPAHPRNGICPECGRQYEHKAILHYWTNGVRGSACTK